MITENDLFVELAQASSVKVVVLDKAGVESFSVELRGNGIRKVERALREYIAASERTSA